MGRRGGQATAVELRRAVHLLPGRGCDSSECEARYARSRWAVCPECDGREGDEVTSVLCQWCMFGVVETGAGGRHGPGRPSVTATAESLQLNAARDVVARLNDPETGGRYERWVERARGCRHPVRLRGASYEADAATGEVVREFNSEGEPRRGAARRRAGTGARACADVL